MPCETASGTGQLRGNSGVTTVWIRYISGVLLVYLWYISGKLGVFCRCAIRSPPLSPPSHRIALTAFIRRLFNGNYVFPRIDVGVSLLPVFTAMRTVGVRLLSAAALS